MKKINILVLILLFVSVYIYAEDIVIPQNNSTVYVVYNTVWAFTNDKDIETQAKNAKGKYLDFGNKLIVVSNKKINDKIYLQVQLPDKTKYWCISQAFTTRFISIIEKNVTVYFQPDSTYRMKIKLQPGYLGYYVKEQDGFVNVNFMMYAPRKSDEQPRWIGNVWIKNGYSDDIQTARVCNFYTDGLNYLYGKNQKIKEGMESLTEAKEACEDISNPLISESINQTLESLGKKEESNTTTINENAESTSGEFYKPNADSVRIRENPGVNGKIIRNLIMGERLKLLETGNEETINDIKAKWNKYETDKGEIGWVFDAFLVIY